MAPALQKYDQSRYNDQHHDPCPQHSLKNGFGSLVLFLLRPFLTFVINLIRIIFRIFHGSRLLDSLRLLYHFHQRICIIIESRRHINRDPADAIHIDFRPGMAVLAGKRDFSILGIRHFRFLKQIAFRIPGRYPVCTIRLHRSGGI